MLRFLIAAAGNINVTANDVNVPNSTANIGVALTKGFQILLGLVGMLAVVFILVGGLQLVYSAGDPGRVKRGRDTLTYAIVGLVLAIASFAIVTFLSTAVH
jgi:hypothetical protein